VAILGVAASLTACISLFPDAEPSQLYRFGSTPTQSQSAPTSEQFGVVRAGGGFVQAAASDRLLTVTNNNAAYIASSRWVSPASVLFNEALQRAFDANPGPARLMTRGEVGKADYSIRVDVTRFEAVYDHGAKAAPNIVIDVRATLVTADRTLAGSKLIQVQTRADDNRVSAIVAAYDQAVAQVLSQLVDWTNARGAT
jgi:cholesterol transport system auxiliary component